jgi:predicted MFS family arabinose efflux permease
VSTNPKPKGGNGEAERTAHLSDSTSGVTFNQFRILVAAGAFATTIAQVRVLGRLPFQTVLKNTYGFDATQIATFMAIAVFAWNLKPFAGLLTDAFPLFGTRRRHYMMIAAGLAALCWLFVGMVMDPISLLPNGLGQTFYDFMGHTPGVMSAMQYQLLLWGAVGLNVFMVFSSTVMGGLMVEAGQRYDAAGRITSLRQIVQSGVSLLNGVAGGFLATKAFGWTAGAGAFLLFTLVPLTYLYLPEKHLAKSDSQVFRNAWAQLKTLGRARTLWSAAVVVFLFYMAPGFQTPLYFMQTDKLQFSTPFIGLIETVAGAFGIASALLYGIYCKRFNLRVLLTFSIASSAAATLMYLFYGSCVAGSTHVTALSIDTLATFIGVVAEVAMMDLAVRCTPRGCEALGFALMMSVRNLAISLNDILGSWLIDHHQWEFSRLVWVNAGTTALVLILIPFLPAVLMNRREGEAA